ncbi:LysR family transcriptional regulator [Granulosicoccus antarcticus]|uniref:HTH-type transcriptional regulator CysL n=1 Tax=Granulosicoccus antarcticus IMCC3135 TaxID=1192854 RepID=A0A2Z2NMN1_9GAMM|nr:LysR family transcriptional regulator [Granulosicoccus antarcticus]ASJ70988.1 HTH-type transcriptional regulator CysL [Granulosicoccus antarcticus IMCC3135]
MINPVLLRSFCTLVEVANFTRTAEQLNMTQSGVSQHVRKLEDQFDQPLLIRHGKQFTLTDAGERLYREGREIIRSLSDLEKRVGADPAYEGLVRVVSPGSVGLKLYRHLLNLQKRHTGLVIDYRFAPNSDVERLIAEHKVDIGFMTSPSTLDEVSFKPVAEEELLLVTPSDVFEPSWEQLSSLGFIDHPDGAYHAGLLLGANYPEFQHSKHFKRAGFSNQINLILEPVSMGLGFTVLPFHAVAAFPEPDHIRVHSLAQSVSETLYLCLHTNKFVPGRVTTVISEAEACLE